MRAQEPRRIRRIGLALEMEDGSTIMVYADQLGAAQVTLATETPMGEVPWDPQRRVIGRPMTSILIEGIGAYLIQWGEPGNAGTPSARALESVRELTEGQG